MRISELRPLPQMGEGAFYMACPYRVASSGTLSATLRSDNTYHRSRIETGTLNRVPKRVHKIDKIN